MKVILINGSPNEHGCTNRALTECKKEFEALGVEAEIFWIGKDAIHGCIGCGGCSKGNGCVFGGKVNEIAAALKNADGMIVGTPVYYASVNGSLLALLDTLYYSAGASLRHMPFGAIASARRAGTTATLDILHKYALINEQPVVGSFYWNMVHGAVNSPEQVEKDEEGLQVCRRLADNMTYLMRCMEAGKEKGIEPLPRPAKIATNFIR